MKARQEHPAMYRGTNGKTFQGNTYFNCKYEAQTKDKVVYVTTMNWDPTTVNYNVGGSQLIDIVTGERINGNSGSYTILLGGLGTRVFQVVEGNTYSVRNADQKFVKNEENGTSDNTPKSKSSNKVVVWCSVVGALVVAAVVGIALFINLRKKKVLLTMIKILFHSRNKFRIIFK